MHGSTARPTPWRALAMCCGMLTMLACSGQPETFRGSSAELDASRGDGSCATTDAPALSGLCANDGDCLALYARGAPSGTIFAICFGGLCRAAQACVETHEGAPDYCSCGDQDVLPWGCYAPTPFCVRAAGAASPTCVAACGSP